MDQAILKGEIERSLGAMSAQIRTAARYVLDRPSDVALLSMREQARRAGVQPATMTRFAKALGLSGYDEVRAIHAQAVREGGAGFAERTSVQVSAQKLKGDDGVAGELASAISAHVARFAEPDSIRRLVAAARRLAEARRVYTLGLRASRPAAWHLHYVMSLVGEKSVDCDGAGGTGLDALARIGPGDACFVVSVSPYTRATVEAARAAKARGAAIVAITDSPVAPLSEIADEAVVVPTESPSFLHIMSPAFVAAEIVAAIVAGRSGDAGLAALREADRHLATLDTHLDASQRTTR